MGKDGVVSIALMFYLFAASEAVIRSGKSFVKALIRIQDEVCFKSVQPFKTCLQSLSQALRLLKKY